MIETYYPSDSYGGGLPLGLEDIMAGLSSLKIKSAKT